MSVNSDSVLGVAAETVAIGVFRGKGVEESGGLVGAGLLVSGQLAVPSACGPLDCSL